MRRQAVLVVVPEQVEQLRVRDHLGVELDVDDLGVVAPEITRDYTLFLSSYYYLERNR